MSSESHRILVIDDSDEVRTVLVEYLLSQGFSAENAGSGREALEKSKSSEFHLFLVDIMMPEMDGLELLKKLDIKPHRVF
jgi:CheY-like chemotaxis protein